MARSDVKGGRAVRSRSEDKGSSLVRSTAKLAQISNL